MKLSSIVPWGRSFDEHVAMFGLSPTDYDKRILGCGDGPASFNAEITKIGGIVISVDPIYEFTGSDIERRFEETAPTIITQVRETISDWVWTYYSSPDELLQSRRKTLDRFLSDYEEGRVQGRYKAAALPSLPFEDNAFDLALCSHLLFLYSEHLSEEFHISSVLELCRVAKEVRIFPLLTLSKETSPYLSRVRKAVESQGWLTKIVQVSYEFQPGGNQMLQIRRS